MKDDTAAREGAAERRTTLKSFDDFITDLDDGELARHLASELQRVVLGVRRTGLSGKLVLELSLKPDGRTVITTPKVKTTIPTAKANSTVFYDTEDGDLSRSDPKQQRLRGVPVRPPTPLRIPGDDKAGGEEN